MKKTLKYLVLLILAIVITTTCIQLLSAKYLKETDLISLSPIDVECRFGRGSYLQHLACFRNFTAPTKTYHFNNEILSVIKTQCDSGDGMSCILFSDFNVLYLGSGAISLPLYDPNKMLINCMKSQFDKGSLTDNLQRNANCSLVERFSLMFGNQLAIDISKQQSCFDNYRPCLDSIKSNILLPPAENIFLKETYCNFKNFTNDDHINYCKRLQEIITFQNAYDASFSTSTKKPDSLFKKIESLCNNNFVFCKKYFSDPTNLKYLIKIDSRFDLNFFDQFNLNIASYSFLVDNLSLQNFSTTKLKNRFLKFKILHVQNKFIEIKSICEKMDEFNYCHLGIDSLTDAINNRKSIQRYCNFGDRTSCDYLKIIDSSVLLHLDKNKKISSYYMAWESVVIEELLQKSTMLKISFFLNSYKYNLIIYLIIICLVLTIYLLIVFNKFEGVFNKFKNVDIDLFKLYTKDISDKIIDEHEENSKIKLVEIDNDPKNN